MTETLEAVSPPSMEKERETGRRVGSTVATT